MRLSEIEALDEVVSAAHEIIAATGSDLEHCGFATEEDRKAHIVGFAFEIVDIIENLQRGKVGEKDAGDNQSIS
ncbi:hypothetical protein IAQ67_28655 (plasmid) [Paenibacillus peoriae]|uniref:Uncharacterized protein n=1 Tax=Paenibacillus peoriae TaxID=59893 RepID=A0A7H0YHC5_9BACL|nr:hypothetical protein [Paenibacillus peoriae]QNR70483.1 hypothetical protein IAQ67_28655 [Paenibacillus peoriae]